MSDQNFIDQNSQLITAKLLEVQERTIAELFALKGSKSAEDFLVFIETLDVEQIVISKSKNAINIFEETHGGMLQSVQGFATLSEKTLNIFSALIASKPFTVSIVGYFILTPTFSFN